MPNWCANRLTVSSEDAGELARFKEAVAYTDEHGELPLSFNKIYPVPQMLLDGGNFLDTEEGRELLERLERASTREQRQAIFSVHPLFALLVMNSKLTGILGGQVEWQSEMWGTKWDLDQECARIEEDGTITYYFESAWSSPLPIVERLARRFPTLWLELAYCEPGCCFAGYVRYENGQRLDECYVDSSMQSCIEVMDACGWTEQLEMFEEMLQED